LLPGQLRCPPREGGGICPPRKGGGDILKGGGNQEMPS